MLGVVSSENEADRIARYKTFVAYMQRRLQVPINMHQATDYAGTIEALKARKMEFARLGRLCAGLVDHRRQSRTHRR
jgi:phosphonate transport system substrate-binding protein